MSVYEKALLDPTSAFTSPEQVLTSAELSREQKIEILHRWEYDARALEVACPAPSGPPGACCVVASRARCVSMRC